MYKKIWRQNTLGLALLAALLACNLPAGLMNPSFEATSAAPPAAAATLAVFPATETPTPAPAATNTSLPSPTPTPQNPLVIIAGLCWEGPGTIYEVVSAVKVGERVELLGRGSISGWWVIKNPIYRDPCWVQENVLQIDPGYNLTNLKIFSPPPTPTRTPIPPTPTP
jgi:hypothetical protein